VLTQQWNGCATVDFPTRTSAASTRRSTSGLPERRSRDGRAGGGRGDRRPRV